MTPQTDGQSLVAAALLIASIEFWLIVFGFYCVTMVRFFRRGDTAYGLVCALLLVLDGGGLALGFPLAMIFGWLRARKWNAVGYMTVFTGMFLAAFGNSAAAVAIHFVPPHRWAGWFG